MKTAIKEVEPMKTCEVCGFVEKIRDQKTMMFIILKDRSGEIQLTIDKKEHYDLSEICAGLTKYSYIKVEGKAGIAPHVKPCGMEFFPQKIDIQSIAEKSPIFDESSLELKADYRWIELRQEKQRLIFEIRTFVERVMREYFQKEGYLEIHSPKITSQSSEGGADVFTVDYYGSKAYLTQSPQFYKQMAMAAGFEKVFEVGAYYRAEKSFTPRHAAESICADFEIADISSHKDIMDEVEKWILYVLSEIETKYGETIEKVFEKKVSVPKFIPRVKLSDVYKIFKEKYGIIVPKEKTLDLDPDAEKKICEYIFDEYGSDLVFVTDYPYESRAFYTKHSKEDEFESMSFDLIYRGWEMCSGAMRETNYKTLKEQIEDKGISSEKMKDYLEFFKYGCPPHGGIGFGIDRFIAKLLGLESIKESIYLFRGPSRIKP